MRLIFYTYIFLLSFFAASQTNNYEVLLGDKIVGSVVATKSKIGTNISYKTVFKIQLKVIKNYDVKSITDAVYKNNVMLKSSMKTYDKEVLDEEKTIVKDDMTYLCTDCKNVPTVSQELIYSSVSKMYFEEPIQNKKVYSERFLGFGIVTDLGNHTYNYKLPNGDVNVYTYKNGIIESIKVDRLLYNLTFKLVE